MSAFIISKWFEVSADSLDEAYIIAASNRMLIDYAEESGIIDVEEVEE